MNYMEELRKSRDKPQVAFQEFALSTGRKPNHFFCFFEGKDNAYYVPQIKRYVGENYHPISCGGRASVLKVHELIRQQKAYDKYRKGFFIDRDFHRPLAPQEPPIFETPCYSIENLYVSETVFREILKNIFHLSEVSDTTVFEACVERYTSLQDSFHEAILPFNAWYACLMDYKEVTGESVQANLSDKPPKGFIKIALDEVTLHYDLAEIKDTFSQAPAITQVQLDEKVVALRQQPLHLILRGKYELYFLKRCLVLLYQDANGPQNWIGDKLKSDIGDASNLSSELMLRIFAPYAEVPEALTNYLEEVI